MNSNLRRIGIGTTFRFCVRCKEVNDVIQSTAPKATAYKAIAKTIPLKILVAEVEFSFLRRVSFHVHSQKNPISQRTTLLTKN